MDYPFLKETSPIVMTPVEMSKNPGKISFRAPTLGEHTNIILKELGYEKEEIESLKEERII